jgi:hypothetical protein
LYHIPLQTGSDASSTPINTFPPCELNDAIQLRLPSPSGSKIAMFMTNKNNEKEQVLELWVGSMQQRRITLPNKAIMDAAGFGMPAWNAQETAIVYSAERDTTKTISFFATKNSDETIVRGGEFTLGIGKQEHWGEKYSKQSALLDLFLIDVESGNVGQDENVPGFHN